MTKEQNVPRFAWSGSPREPEHVRHWLANRADLLAASRRERMQTLQRDVDATHAVLQRVWELDAIIDEECRYDRITIIDLLQRSDAGGLRRRHAETRAAICTRARDLGMSAPETARALGMRSHASVLDAQKRGTNGEE